MSLQWTLVAGVMYAELAFTIILLIPLISPQRWNKFFKSSFLRSIGNMSHIYFKIFLGVLILFFIDAIREMRKYSGELDGRSSSDHAAHLDSEMQSHMRLFRAQRNFYISGFSLFLWVVLRRLTSLISVLAVTMAEKEAAMKQAMSATEAATKLIKKGDSTKDEKEEAVLQKETNTANEIKELKEENRRLEAEYKAALKQATSVTNEYDRLLKEHSTLQEDFKKVKGNEGSKKGD